MRRYSEGSPTATVVIVGEALGFEELKKGRPFSGASGWELDKMLGEAGLARHNCYLTNVIHDTKPFESFYGPREGAAKGIRKVNGRFPHPKVEAGRLELEAELEQLSPNLIIAMGDVALWAVTGLSDGINRWRGSVLETRFGKVIPTFNPAAVLRNWSDRWISVQDLRRCFRESMYPEVKKPDWNFLVRPTFIEAKDAIQSIRGKLVAGDIETRSSQIACVGFATDKTNAFCVPFMQVEDEGNFWSDQEELELTLLLRDVLTDPSTRVIFQNGAYDLQYFAKQWGFVPNMSDDTMLMMHVCFPGLKKSLDFQSSLFCDFYRYWKDDGKTWDKHTGEEQHWTYNCTDCVYTFENYEVLRDCLETYNLTEQYEFQMRLFWPVFKMMLQGVRVDRMKKQKLSGELLIAQQSRMEWLEKVLGHPFNPKSPKQMQTLFYEDLRLPKIKNRKTKALTTDSKALATLKTKQPLVTPLIDVIEEIRSIGVFKSTFADALVDSDDRIRSSINLTGTETFRFSSSKNIFGTGMNLQNIPSGTED